MAGGAQVMAMPGGVGTPTMLPGTPDMGMGAPGGGGMGVGQQVVHDPVAMASHLQQIQYQVSRHPEVTI